MALPLNVFKTVPAAVTNTNTVIYTAPVGYTAILLLAQVTNTGVASQTINLFYRRGVTDTPVIYQYELPAKEVLTISGGSAGKLVVETGDQLVLSGSSTDLQFISSILETLQ